MQLLGLTGVMLFATLAISAGIAWAEPSPSGSQPKAPATQPVPSPQLSPEEVVKIVTDALGANDANDNGIRTTFNFASPSNKEVTGPIEHFIPLVKNPMYEPMLNHRSATFKKLAADANHAQELVTLITNRGTKVYYVFILSKQTDGEFKDCWMTDGVQRVEPMSPTTQPAPPRDLPDGQLPA